MASADTLCKKILNVKNTVVESHEFYIDTDGVNHLHFSPTGMPEEPQTLNNLSTKKGG